MLVGVRGKVVPVLLKIPRKGGIFPVEITRQKKRPFYVILFQYSLYCFGTVGKFVSGKNKRQLFFGCIAAYDAACYFLRLFCLCAQITEIIGERRRSVHGRLVGGIIGVVIVVHHVIRLKIGIFIFIGQIDPS
ncbi:hypothetical protein SDC9_205111 [bioreactor metagenome]|uniref:Uncharacterized protein n=1 Tax=bioreactor metagenome TaxID=1076179 RepID=A0A645J1Y5_9ZZZZ